MNAEPDIVFMDFEASSLGKKSYPIEVAWVFASGGEESHLIKPISEWTDWSMESQATHQITRDELIAQGTPLEALANRMLEVLSSHHLYATAPSWDGQWLSKLLRGAGLPRHALRLEDTDVAHENAIRLILQQGGVALDEQARIAKDILSQARQKDESEGEPVHRALADAQRELRVWRDVQQRAAEYTKSLKREA